MQTDLSNFIHTIHLDLATRVNLVQNLLKTKELPVGFKKKLNEFAALLSITRSNVHLVTVKKQKYYVYRYEGKLNGIENAVVLLCYPEKAFGNPKALQAFLSTDVSLSVDETLSYYAGRWPIYFFASVRINWHWTATRYVLRRGSEDIGCSCQWHLVCLWQGPVNSVLLKKATTELEALSRQKSISISSDVQKKVMILMHL